MVIRVFKIFGPASHPPLRYSAPAVVSFGHVQEKRGIEGVRRTEGVLFSGFAFFLPPKEVFFSF